MNPQQEKRNIQRIEELKEALEKSIDLQEAVLTVLQKENLWDSVLTAYQAEKSHISRREAKSAHEFRLDRETINRQEMAENIPIKVKKVVDSKD